MKNKLVALVLAFCAVFFAFGLVSCGDDNAELAFNTKYIAWRTAGDDKDEQSYVIFYKNNTGEYRYYGGFLEYDYTIKFKYTYVDKDKSAVMCFYDSIEGKRISKDENTWTAVFTVSKNALMANGSANYSYFINEKYLKEELPNYGKDVADD